MPLPNSPNSIWRKFKAVVENAVPGRAPRGVARHGTARYGTRPTPPRLYFLAGVTRRAYFYGLYYFAFLECALPGVNPRPQFGQCTVLCPWKIREKERTHAATTPSMHLAPSCIIISKQTAIFITENDRSTFKCQMST